MSAPTQLATIAIETLERRARHRWVGFIAAFFVLQAMLWSFALHRVHSDPSHAVVEDYDQRALRWDEHRARQAASDALGWRAVVRLRPNDGPSGAAIEVELTDPGRGAVAADEVVATLFHQSAAANKQTIALTRARDGVFSGEAAVHRPGKWRIRIDARRGADHYASTQTHEVPAEVAG